MMALVSRDDIQQGPDRDAVPAGGAALLEGVGVQVLGQMNRRRADDLKFLDQIRQRSSFEISILDIEILVEARERGLVLPGETERPISEDAFGVGDVADD